MLSGINEWSGLKNLMSYLDECLKNGKRIEGLSKILSDPEFLKSCYYEIRGKKGSSTLGLDSIGLDGINTK
jgi:hypothetical protein